MASNTSKKQLLEWEDELLTSGEVADLLRVDAKTVARWQRAGLINSIRTLGGHRRYWKTDVVRLLKSNDPNEVRFLLWSNRYQKWWVTDQNEYTDDVDEAGRFSEWEAVHYVVESAYSLDRQSATLMVADRAKVEPGGESSG
jgi:excisionase family DNA binding protein